VLFDHWITVARQVAITLIVGDHHDHIRPRDVR
jgi:hypothetical protein